ncbi:hypothetical protein G5B46_14910 [Caulobacter sp. 602-2]|uniref:Uncharacterized protein n=1 Tax=Caulobacter sp. 602-2 TaxID=2710887 RepID=A0A6G4QZE3_9CAUL|nr:hypothetical protein [Caulobacter sp. 602-2]NGM50902.1 hypothetical protein [Caulobacter sp. 602-2]
MSEELDHLMEAMRRRPSARLDGLEGRVWARIDALRQPSGMLLTPLRAASVVAALGIGMIGGSLATTSTTSKPVEIAAFSVDAHLAPSTLLDGR